MYFGSPQGCTLPHCMPLDCGDGRFADALGFLFGYGSSMVNIPLWYDSGLLELVAGI